MTHLETLAREYANKLYPLGNDEHEGTFVTDEAYPEDYRLDVCGAFLAGAQARQPEIDELVVALKECVSWFDSYERDFLNCCIKSKEVLKKHGNAKE